MTAVNLSERLKERIGIEPLVQTFTLESFSTPLIQIIFHLWTKAQAQGPSAALGLSCAHGCQILLLPNRPYKSSQTSDVNRPGKGTCGGLVLLHQSLHLPTPSAPAPVLPSRLHPIPAFVGNAAEETGKFTARCLGPAARHLLETCMLAAEL